MPGRTHRPLAAVVTAATALILAACSSTVAGSVALTTVPAAAGEADLALLDPGNYPTKPRPPLGAVGEHNGAAFLEGARLADNVVGPWQVNPALVDSPHAGPKPSDFAQMFSLEAMHAAMDHQVVALFSTNRSAAAEDRGMGNSVLRFPTPEDAAAAATDMATRSLNQKVGGDSIAYDPTPIPRYPDASGLIHSWDPGWSMVSYLAHGPYVLAVWADSRDSAEAAGEVIAATLDQQGPLIDQFQPTPVDQLKNLPIDPDGLLARTLPPDTPDHDRGEIYWPSGQLHFDTAPIRSKTIFDDAHLQQVAVGRGQVYQTPDAGSAQKIVDGFAAESTDKGFVLAAGITGLPGATCLTRKDDRRDKTTFYCLAVAGRYAIEVSSGQERDAHQRVSAQYLMLTATP